MRKLPVYLLLDTSGSMSGVPLAMKYVLSIILARYPPE